MIKFLLMLGFSFVLAACGNSGGGGSNDNVSSGDSFIARVQQVVATSSEDSEPADVETVTTTVPEDAEPMDVG